VFDYIALDKSHKMITFYSEGKNYWPYLNGLIEAINILKKIDGISCINFEATDVVRHSLVKDIIKAYSKNEDKNE